MTNTPTATAYAQYPSLHDKVVFVTGGAAGIGAAVVEAFIAQKCKVGFVDCDSGAGEKLRKTCATKYGATPFFQAVDVRDSAQLQKAIAVCHQELGAITILVNNAGNDDRHAVAEVTPEYFDDRIAVNLKHHFFAAQTVQKQMQDAGGGSIINMGSISWMGGMRNAALYNTSKAAIVGLTKSLAGEFGDANIRVNTVMPGAVFTQRQLDKWLTPEGIEWILNTQKIHQRIMPEDVARLVLWLASDDSRYVTAQSIILDAGMM